MLGSDYLGKVWLDLDREVTMLMIFDLTKAVTLGFLLKFSNLAVTGRLLKAAQNF
jgi:hypothetical protein